MEFKKDQSNIAFAVVVAIIVVSVVLIVGIWVVNSFTNTVTMTTTYTHVINETNTLADATAKSLTNNPYGVTNVWNNTHTLPNCRATTGVEHLDGCWNLTQTHCKYTCANQVVMFANATYFAGEWNITYDFAPASYVAGNNSMSNAEATTWNSFNLAVVALIVLAAVAIISLLFAGFGGMGGL